MSSEQQNDILSINQVQLLLSEKRTALSVMRTGIAVLALPLSIFSALIATSKWYNVVWRCGRCSCWWWASIWGWPYLAFI